MMRLVPNPLSAHWLRISVLLLLVTPVIAFAVAFSSGVDYMIAVFFTLYTWLLVCVILAGIALTGLIGRLVGKGIRALRR
jgi:hypothetical protein